VQELIGLSLDGLDHLGVTVAGGTNRDTGGEIQKKVVIHIMDPETVASLDDQRVNPCVGR